MLTSNESREDESNKRMSTIQNREIINGIIAGRNSIGAVETRLNTTVSQLNKYGPEMHQKYVKVNYKRNIMLKR